MSVWQVVVPRYLGVTRSVVSHVLRSCKVSARTSEPAIIKTEPLAAQHEIELPSNDYPSRFRRAVLCETRVTHDFTTSLVLWIPAVEMLEEYFPRSYPSPLEYVLDCGPYVRGSMSKVNE